MTAFNPGHRSRTGAVGAVLVVSMIVGGWLIERGTRAGPVQTRAEAARLFDNVLVKISRNYVDSIDLSMIYRKAVDGMLYELEDPYTTLLPPDKLGQLTETTSGDYAGIGIQADVRDGWIIVIAPTAGSPAERAGVQPGDRIVGVDGKSAQDWTLEEAMNSFRGKAGTSVLLRIERPGLGAAIPLKLVREPLHQSAVRRIAMLPNGVGYVDLKAFSDSTQRELSRAVSAIVRKGAKSLIIDMRSNPGGLLEQGTRVADLFLDKDQRIVSLRGRTPEANRDFVDSTAQKWPMLPLTVLVNDRSASAAEIVAGALQDHDRAVIVGEPTYGKGSAQTIIPLGEVGGLKITTSRWYTPSGRSISRRTTRDDGNTDPADDRKKEYKTDAGRTVYDGGGITPDLIESDSAYMTTARILQSVLGRKVSVFRDALTDYALSLRVSKAISSPQFDVTPRMLDEVWKRMVARGVVMDRSVYDESSSVVKLLLTYDIARYVFGPDAEFRRRVGNDHAIATALQLASGVTTQRELLDRARSRQELQQKTLGKE